MLKSLAGQAPQMTPQLMDQMQKSLSDPATADMITAFTQSMKPEDLASLLKQSGGIDVSNEQVKLAANCTCRIQPVACRAVVCDQAVQQGISVAAHLSPSCYQPGQMC